MWRYLFISLLCIAFTGCDSAYQGSVVVTAKAPQLEIFNDTKNPVHYIAVETELSHLIDIANPCERFQPNLPAGSTITIPYSEIMGMDKDAKSVSVMWTDCKDSGDSQTVSLY